MAGRRGTVKLGPKESDCVYVNFWRTTFHKRVEEALDQRRRLREWMARGGTPMGSAGIPERLMRYWGGERRLRNNVERW